MKESLSFKMRYAAKMVFSVVLALLLANLICYDCFDADDGVLVYRTGLGNNGKKAVIGNFHYEVLSKRFLKVID